MTVRSLIPAVAKMVNRPYAEKLAETQYFMAIRQFLDTQHARKRKYNVLVNAGS